MQLGWTTLALLILTALVAWFWQDSLGARERANAAALEACTRLGLQFLDGTVAFARLQILRGSGRLFALRRTYVFDYTADSIERRQGFVILTDQRVDTVGYARGEEAREPVADGHYVDAPQLPPASNVLSLEEWRSRQRSATNEPRRNHNGTHAKDR